MFKYTHLKLNQDIEAPAGHYTPLKEVRLIYNGREVLYVLNGAVIDASCCGTADYASAQVPGYIVSWQGETSRDGLPVSAVEPIADIRVQDGVRKIIKETEHLDQVEFW